ncbi:hypothetical protein [Pelagibius marinus]|uniref:hypothetical protein n=1 Tax=Pelagibius marinus TaxID=2762760 RepID=UPI00187259CB|nr:hypothetical protein [Pelagibius marinus]
MKLRFLPLALVFLVTASALLLAPGAFAGILSVDTTQARIPVSSVGPSTVTVTWQVLRLGGSAPSNPGTISSPSGTLIVNGTVLATNQRPLSRFAPGPPATTESLIFTETFTVPQAVAFRAIKSGVPIVYQRTFTDSLPTTPPSSLSGTTLLTPSGPGSAPFNVSRMELRFDDGSRFKVLPKGRRLRAVARLNTSGNGLIRGQWEIATAATTAGTPVFRTLALVRRPVAGGRPVTITSPPLPTRFEGNNLVRLRLDDPEVLFDEPQLQYYVTPESPLPQRRDPQPMLVTSPSLGTPLTLTTRFSWQALPGAHLYKLEIFGAPPGPGDNVATNEVVTDVPLDRAPNVESVRGLTPLTGIVVPAAVTEVRLQDFTLEHLPGDRRYEWSVKALDKEGAVIGRSPAREIYKP